jgi:hypothetical protein
VDIDVEYICQNKYGEALAHFLNKYGVYESFVFNAMSRGTEEVRSETYEQPIYKQEDMAEAWDLGVGITTPYLNQAWRTLMVNTPYLDDSEVDLIRQMHLSRNIVLVEDSTIKSVRVVDSSFMDKSSNNDKLVQYALNLKYNHPEVNAMIR